MRDVAGALCVCLRNDDLSMSYVWPGYYHGFSQKSLSALSVFLRLCVSLFAGVQSKRLVEGGSLPSRETSV